MSVSTRGIVVGRESFGEADQYIQFFTEDYGLVTALARSARKSKRRYVGGLDLFCHDEIFLRGNPSERAYLNELTVLNSFPQLRELLPRLLVAGRVVHWVRKLANVATPMPNIYRLLGQTLTLIEKESDEDRFELLNLLFRIKFLSALGLEPRLNSCIRCENETSEPFVFDTSAGGMICRACTEGYHVDSTSVIQRIERDFVVGLNKMQLSKWSELRSGLDYADRWNRLLLQFTTFHTHVKLPI